MNSLRAEFEFVNIWGYRVRLNINFEYNVLEPNAPEVFIITIKICFTAVLQRNMEIYVNCEYPSKGGIWS